MLNASIGERLRELRKSQHKTQQTVADAINIKRSTLSNYEIGRRRPSLDELKALAQYYNVSLDFFGVAPSDDLADIIARASKIFKSDDIPDTKKDALYMQLAQLYFQIKSKKD